MVYRFGPRATKDARPGDEGSASDEEQPSERSERGQAEGSASDEPDSERAKASERSIRAALKCRRPFSLARSGWP